MRRFVYQLVARLSDPGAELSRNRHHALLSSPAGQRALRLSRHLASLERDYARFQSNAQLAVRETAAGLEVRMEVPGLRLVRVAALTPDDLAILATRRGPLRDALARHLPSPEAP
jgi:hypothetical protein